MLGNVHYLHNDLRAKQEPYLFFLPSHVKVELQRVSDGERCLTVVDVGADLAVNL